MITFTAPCPACGRPCRWEQFFAIGDYGTSGFRWVIDCDCEPARQDEAEEAA